MIVQTQVSLKPYNTFGLDVLSAEYTELNSIEDVKAFCAYIRNDTKPFLIIGGGSNVLLTQNFAGITARICLKGIYFESVSDTIIRACAEAGEIWHSFVLQTIDQGLYGLENLSLIPGSVGAAPMQNIGAYGIEIKDRFDYLEAIEISSGTIRRFSHADCRFGYRESIFKHDFKNQYIILRVAFLLSKEKQIKTSYGAIQEQLEQMGIKNPSNRDVSNAVIAIRKSKLPDPSELGNSGSFFKNPEIPFEQYEQLKNQYPNIPGYTVGERVKVPAGWLIEQCGWKGKVVGNTGSHAKQALVLVNYGNASGMEIFKLAKDIQQSVFNQFGIQIEMEVNIV